MRASKYILRVFELGSGFYFFFCFQANLKSTHGTFLISGLATMDRRLPSEWRRSSGKKERRVRPRFRRLWFIIDRGGQVDDFIIDYRVMILHATE